MEKLIKQQKGFHFFAIDLILSLILFVAMVYFAFRS